MTVFLRNGNTYRSAAEEMLDMHEQLPAGNYVIKQDLMKNFYFEQVDSFTCSTKIYGDTTRNAERMIRTFHDRPNSTGVLLTGEKGSGKTLLAKTLSMKCAEEGIPTIIINTNWNGDAFNTLIQSIEQPCMILFDEFEKVYSHNEQLAILTLLDGVFPSKKLFVLTCNDKWRIDENMRNRPGRIFYMLDFRGLDVEFITSYCNENLDNKLQIENVCRVSTMFSEFNFDLLKALVEEMNRYKESAQEAIKMLNAKPQSDTGGTYKVTLKIAGKIVPENEVAPREWDGNPLSEEAFKIRKVAANSVNDDDDDDEVGLDNTASAALSVRDEYHHFTYLHLKNVDPKSGSFTYTNDTGASVTFTKVKKEFHYHAF